jgi:hypothetical protein
VQLLHGLAKTRASFDDPNLVSAAGLVPVMALLRAAGALASRPFAKAKAATIRRDLIAIAARTARHGRGHLTLHLPQVRHREQEWMNLWDAACGPPAATA